jgi:type IV fimbrial biogenesis protein FimT
MAARTPAQRRASARQSGFTMLELMITVSLVVILGMIIIPSFSYVMSANRATSQINGLLGDIQFARAEAIKEGLSVGICASSNGTTCSGSATWTSGWIVYADTAGTGTVATGEPILRVQKAISGSDTLTADNTTKFIAFNRDGFAFGLTNTVTFALHNSTNTQQYTRCLSVNIVGRLATELYGQTLQGGNACS